MLTHAPWMNQPGLRHGFLDRDECLDAPDWEGVLRHQGIRLPIVRPRQVHGASVIFADEVTPTSEADAAVATRGGIAVGIVTADCVPVLLRDRGRRAVAAVHAGWRGTAAGIVEATFAALHRILGVEAHDVEIVIGPAIGGCCYEVGADVRSAFAERFDEPVMAAFVPRRDRFMLDLRAVVRVLAESEGAETVSQLGPCTACHRAYASYRRDGAAAGRQVSFIALT